MEWNWSWISWYQLNSESSELCQWESPKHSKLREACLSHSVGRPIPKLIKQLVKYINNFGSHSWGSELFEKQKDSVQSMHFPCVSWLLAVPKTGRYPNQNSFYMWFLTDELPLHHLMSFCMFSIWAAFEHILICSCPFQAFDNSRLEGKHWGAVAFRTLPAPADEHL